MNKAVPMVEVYPQQSIHQIAIPTLDAYGVAAPRRSSVAFVLAIAAFFAILPWARAQDAAPAGVAKFVTPAEMRSGALLLRSGEERFVEAPLVGTDVDLSVSGPTARARVTQMFHNPTDGWVEAVYVYPLPPGAAVDTLKMVIGERVVDRRDQGPRGRARGLRAGQGRRPEGEPDRAGAPEHLHQLGRQYRPARDRRGPDRIPGAGAAVGRGVLAARAAGGGAAL